MRFSPFLLAIPIVAACSLSPEVAGSADVLGQVLSVSGEPLASSTVAINCRGIATKSVPTNAEGRYAVNLTAPSAGRLGCVFAVPDLVTPRIRLDTTIGFAPNGQLHAEQFIDLREASAP